MGSRSLLRLACLSLGLFVGSALVLPGCGDGSPDTSATESAPTAEAPSGAVAAAAVEAIEAAASPTVVGAREGRLQFSVEGGIFPTPVTFDLRSDQLRGLQTTSEITVLRVQPGDAWVAENGQAVLTTLIFKIDAARGADAVGTYDASKYDFTFGLSADRARSNVKSIRPEGETGTVTVTERTDTHVSGTFEVRGHATQMNSREPLYTIRGSFSFACRR